MWQFFQCSALNCILPPDGNVPFHKPFIIDLGSKRNYLLFERIQSWVFFISFENIMGLFLKRKILSTTYSALLKLDF